MVGPVSLDQPFEDTISSRTGEVPQQSNQLDLAMVVHDFRVPLCSIRLALALLSTQPLGMDQNANDLLKTATENIEFLVDLTDALLALNYSNRVLTTSPSPLSLPELMTQIIRQTMLSAQAKTISIDSSVDGEIPFVLGSSVGLRRVFQNLISNAVKFTPEGGRIQISIGTNLAPSMVRIEVSDTGPGIPEGQEEIIFEAFKSNAHPTVGMGLGLAISKTIIECHGGTINVKRNPSNGLCFQVLMPIRRQPSPTSNGTL